MNISISLNFFLKKKINKIFNLFLIMYHTAGNRLMYSYCKNKN